MKRLHAARIDQLADSNEQAIIQTEDIIFRELSPTSQEFFFFLF